MIQLDGSYSDCLPGVSTLPAMRNPSCASYVSHDAPSNYGASSPLYPPKRISDGESFWSSSPTDHSFSSSTNSPSNWNSFQGITDPFGFTEHIHGLPNVPLADINLHSNGLSSLSLDYPIYSPTPACGSFSSAGAIDMMESMALKEEIANNIWTTSMCDQGMPAPTFALDSPLFSNAMKAEVTVSPKQLKIHPTPTPTSSVGSVHTSFFAGGDSDSATMAHESPYLEPSSSEGTSRRHRRDGTQQNRKQLPDKPTHHRYVPILPDDRSRSVDKGEYTAKAKPAAKAKTPRFKPARQQRSCNIAVPAAPNSSDERSAKDDFLVKSKLAGMTYKEIRRKGGFTEAESTLRGRFRTLTKNKEARVRKPEWSDIDVSTAAACSSSSFFYHVPSSSSFSSSASST